MKIKFKPIDDSAYDSIKQELFDDLIYFGECAYKTSIENGKPTIKYVDPISDELRIAMYNAEHKDSQGRIHPLTPDECYSVYEVLKHQKPTNNS